MLATLSINISQCGRFFHQKLVFIKNRHQQKGLQSQYQKLSHQSKTKIIDEYARSKKDTGSPEVQIAILSERSDE